MINLDSKILEDILRLAIRKGYKYEIIDFILNGKNISLEELEYWNLVKKKVYEILSSRSKNKSSLFDYHYQIDNSPGKVSELTEKYTRNPFVSNDSFYPAISFYKDVKQELEKEGYVIKSRYSVFNEE